jgi:hypothetical protein
VATVPVPEADPTEATPAVLRVTAAAVTPTPAVTVTATTNKTAATATPSDG